MNLWPIFEKLIALFIGAKLYNPSIRIIRINARNKEGNGFGSIRSSTETMYCARRDGNEIVLA